MATRTAIKEHQCSSIDIERAANGWVVTPKYHHVYDNVPSTIASSVEEALKAAEVYMTHAHVTKEETW